MIFTRRAHLRILSAAVSGAVLPAWPAGPDFSEYTDEEKEKFLQAGTIKSVEAISHGVTRPSRVTLVAGGIEHPAHFQTIDKDLPDFFPKEGRPIPMKDSWKYNIAAYRLDRLVGLKMVPVAIPRPFEGKPAALSWWVDDVLFEEAERVKKELAPPDAEDFARQRAVGAVFDELIINIDRNLSNLLITKGWKVALIDHTRSFTAYHGIRNEANLTRCSRGLLTRMKALTAAAVAGAMGPHLTKAEVAAVIGRRDRIVDFFAREAKAKGEEKVLFS